VDLDAEVESREGRSIPAIFEEQGEGGFRVAESEALIRVAEQPSSVVACGGGIVTVPGNRQVMRESGSVVYLETGIESVRERLGSGDDRPLFGPEAETLLESRRALYRAWADEVVATDGRTAEEVADEVVTVLEGR
jgi:shikimate kinase